MNGKSQAIRKFLLDEEAIGQSPLRLTDQAYRTLEEMIITLQLAPGSTCSEAAICERINIGRTPVREALQRLALEQLVQIVPRYGVIVTEILVPEQIMVVEMRRVLEPLIASTAARRSSVREKVRIAELRLRLLETLEAGDVLEYLRLHFVIRHFVSRSTRNKFLASAIAPIDALSRRFFYVHQSQPDQLLKAGKLHADVLHAIATENEPEAVSAANRLINYIEEFTRAAFKV